MAYTSKYTGGQIEEKLDMAFASSLQEKTVDISENGLTEVLPDEGYFALKKVNVNVGMSKNKWTGHADAEGLRAIGWTEEDIAYYQENGVNWNEEEDEYHKVSEDNKALYGVLSWYSISSYRERIVYLPRISVFGTSGYQTFYDCKNMVAIPKLSTQNLTSMNGIFGNCKSLVCLPPLDTQNVTDMGNMCSGCYSLVSVGQLDTSKVTRMGYMFNECYSLVNFPALDTSNVTSSASMLQGCYALRELVYDAKNSRCPLSNLYSLVNCHLINLNTNETFNYSPLLSKESLIYIINNEAATSAIKITLNGSTYDRYATDVDVIEALTNHPNVSIAKQY